MPYTPVLLTILVLFMIAGAIPARGGGQTAIFASPLFIALLAVLAGVLLRCSLRRRHLRHAGFVLCHVGLVLVLAGALAGFLFGQRAQFAVPVEPSQVMTEIPGPGERPIPLPFGLSVDEFSVRFYDPEYHLYRPPQGTGDYTFERTLAPDREGTLVVGAALKLAAAELRDAQGGWVRQHVLPDGRLLQMAEPVARHYEAALRISHDDRPSRRALLSVNHPVSEQGWRFYLMSYDQRQQQYVVLSARRDPGRCLVIPGLWAAILGSAWLCWFPMRRPGRRPTAPAGEEVSHEPA